MADPTIKSPENVAGRFYVDETCIDCDLCHETAPGHFARNPDEGRSYVVRQPESQDEADLCAQALDDCPVDAIGEDH